jgi:hypothetical protein
MIDRIYAARGRGVDPGLGVVVGDRDRGCRSVIGSDGARIPTAADQPSRDPAQPDLDLDARFACALAPEPCAPIPRSVTAGDE